MEVVKDKDEDTRRSVEEDLNSPCAEEMAAFEKFINYFELKQYDIIIIDTAPTGHTLRLLELPSDWKGFIDIGDLTKKTSEETKNMYAIWKNSGNLEERSLVSDMPGSDAILAYKSSSFIRGSDETFRNLYFLTKS